MNSVVFDLGMNNNKEKKMMKSIICLMFIFVGFSLLGESKVFEIEMLNGTDINKCNVNFTNKKPKPSTVDKMLRTALEMSVEIDDSKNILATAFYEDEVMSSSDRLIYDSSKKKIVTWDEYNGTKSTGNDTGKYFVKVQERETAISPKRKWLNIMIVFATKPTQKQAYNAIIETTKKYTKKKMKINSYVSVGDKKNKRSWMQVKDSSGGYISTEYSPSSGELTSRNGKVLKTFK